MINNKQLGIFGLVQRCIKIIRYSLRDLEAVMQSVQCVQRAQPVGNEHQNGQQSLPTNLISKIIR